MGWGSNNSASGALLDRRRNRVNQVRYGIFRDYLEAVAVASLSLFTLEGHLP